MFIVFCLNYDTDRLRISCIYAKGRKGFFFFFFFGGGGGGHFLCYVFYFCFDVCIVFFFFFVSRCVGEFFVLLLIVSDAVDGIKTSLKVAVHRGLPNFTAMH